MSEQNSITSPEPTVETAAYWEAANAGRFILKRCQSTGKAFFPPRNHSPFTGLAETDWIDASGTGTLYSFSVMRRKDSVSCIAYVELSEGPIIQSAIKDCDFDSLEIGQTVQVLFVPSENGQMVPMFTAAAID